MSSGPETVDVPPELREVFREAEALVAAHFAEKRGTPSQGTIEIAGERYVLLRAASLSVRFFSIVRELYGEGREREADEFVRNILFDLAHGVGRSDARDFARRRGIEDPIARLSAGPVHFAYAGWAKVQIDPASRPVAGDEFVLFYDHPYSFESDAWLRAGERADFPVCIMNAGYSSGWCEASFSTRLVAAEVLCRARGDDHCRFVMAPPHRIEERVASFVEGSDAPIPSGYQIPDLFARKTVEEKLRRAKEELEERVRERTAALETEMSRRERAEKQLRQSQKMEAIGRLSGGIAHDFNNVLGVILGCASVLERRYPDEEAVDLIRQSASRAATLTTQLLAFSRSQILQAEPVDLVTVLDEGRAMFGHLLGEQIRVEVEAPDPVMVRASPDGAQQVLLNLALNARDAMPRGGRLSLRAEEVEVAAGEIPELATGRFGRLVVRDDGEGMSEATRERVFDPFFTTKGDEGTGLGLSTAHGIVHQFGGTIRVTSEPGVGTRFDVYLPAHDGDGDAAPQEPAPPPLVGPLGPLSILLVEDDALLRTIVRDILEQEGHTTHSAGSATEALELLADGPLEVELLLTDVVLPGMNGRALADEVRRARPGIRVLFMSGYADDHLLRRGLLGEGASCLHKPFNAQELLERIRDVVTR